MPRASQGRWRGVPEVMVRVRGWERVRGVRRGATARLPGREGWGKAESETKCF